MNDNGSPPEISRYPTPESNKKTKHHLWELIKGAINKTSKIAHDLFMSYDIISSASTSKFLPFFTHGPGHGTILFHITNGGEVRTRLAGRTKALRLQRLRHWNLWKGKKYVPKVNIMEIFENSKDIISMTYSKGNFLRQISENVMENHV